MAEIEDLLQLGAVSRRQVLDLRKELAVLRGDLRRASPRPAQPSRGGLPLATDGGGGPKPRAAPSLARGRGGLW